MLSIEHVDCILCTPWLSRCEGADSQCTACTPTTHCQCRPSALWPSAFHGAAASASHAQMRVGEWPLFHRRGHPCCPHVEPAAPSIFHPPPEVASDLIWSGTHRTVTFQAKAGSGTSAMNGLSHPPAQRNGRDRGQRTSCIQCSKPGSAAAVYQLPALNAGCVSGFASDSRSASCQHAIDARSCACISTGSGALLCRGAPHALRSREWEHAWPATGMPLVHERPYQVHALSASDAACLPSDLLSCSHQP